MFILRAKQDTVREKGGQAVLGNSDSRRTRQVRTIIRAERTPSDSLGAKRDG